MRYFLSIATLAFIGLMNGAKAETPTPKMPFILFECPQPENVTLEKIKEMKKNGFAKILTKMVDGGLMREIEFRPASDSILDVIHTKTGAWKFEKTLKLSDEEGLVNPQDIDGRRYCYYAFESTLGGEKSFAIVGDFLPQK